MGDWADWLCIGRPHSLAALEAGIFKQGAFLSHYPACTALSLSSLFTHSVCIFAVIADADWMLL